MQVKHDDISAQPVGGSETRDEVVFGIDEE